MFISTEAAGGSLNSERSAILARLPLFQHLEAAVIARLAGACSLLDVPRSHQLFRRGEPCRGFHVVLGGQVKLSMSSDRGDEKVIEIVGPGQSFGEAVMFLGRDYIVSAATLSPATLLYVPRKALEEEFDRDPTIIRRVLASLSLRLHHLLADIEDYSLSSGRARTIGFLLNQAANAGDSRQVQLPFAKSLVASRLNVTQEHFSRILHQLAAEGFIEVQGSTVLLRDLAALRAAA